MTQDEIIQFAIQCRLVTSGNREGLYMDALTEFANLVAAKALAQERKPLTDEEIDAVTDSQWAKGVNKPIYAAHRAYARAIEAKLKERNT